MMQHPAHDVFYFKSFSLRPFLFVYFGFQFS